MISIKNLYKSYSMRNAAACNALNGINLQIHDGEMLAITGKSGAGKSTLLHIIGCIDDYDSGTVLVDDVELGNLSDAGKAHFRNSVVGIVLQDFALVPDYTVYENVSIPLVFSKKKQRNRKKQIEEILDEVGMKDSISKNVNQLSGGQKQRVAIARALINNPKYILADEPTGALDSETSRQIMNLLSSLNKKGITVIIITHDPDIAAMCSRTVCIGDGVVKTENTLVKN